MNRTLIVIVAIVLSQPVFGQKFELAQTPPMGWNSWNKFDCNVSEELIKRTADAMVSSGMKEAGYEYIVIDDCWQIERDKEGNIVADPERFPSGIKALADYIHSRGLKFGLYTCAGTRTCEDRPGSRGYEYQDMAQYASWEVDFVKVDWCNTHDQNALASYRLFSEAIKSAGRPMILSICEWGRSEPWTWAGEIGHMWRTTIDIDDCWDCKHTYGFSWGKLGWLRILDLQDGIRQYAGPGRWNDPDMLEVGNGGMTRSENRAHFSMWCMLAAPLIAGNDLENMSEETKEILTNKEVIAVNQDPRGVQAYKAVDFGDLEYWVKPLEGENLAICFLNRGDKEIQLEFDWNKYDLVDFTLDKQTWLIDEQYMIRDLWQHKDLGKAQKIFKAVLPAHDVIMLSLTKN